VIFANFDHFCLLACPSTAATVEWSSTGNASVAGVKFFRVLHAGPRASITASLGRGSVVFATANPKTVENKVVPDKSPQIEIRLMSASGV